MHNLYGCLSKIDTDLVGLSDVHLARINSESLSKCSFIDNFDICTSFVGICALTADIFISKARLCIRLETRTWAFGLNKLLRHNE